MLGCGRASPQASDPVSHAFSDAQQASPTQTAPQAGTPASAVSQALGDTQQAVGLIDSIYKIVEPAIFNAIKKRDETNYMKKFIGPW
jgi:hypothetical protein